MQVNRVTIKDVKRLSEATGVVMTTWSPGDGMTRYRFVKATEFPDYLGSSGSDVLGTCLGAKEAYAWLQGYRACQLSKGD